MAFETDDATVYQVRGRHRNEEVREVVPGDYAGVMVTDRALRCAGLSTPAQSEPPPPSDSANQLHPMIQQAI